MRVWQGMLHDSNRFNFPFVFEYHFTTLQYSKGYYLIVCTWLVHPYTLTYLHPYTWQSVGIAINCDSKSLPDPDPVLRDKMVPKYSLPSAQASMFHRAPFEELLGYGGGDSPTNETMSKWLDTIFARSDSLLCLLSPSVKSHLYFKGCLEHARSLCSSVGKYVHVYVYV